MATATAAQPSPQPESNWWLVVAGSLVVHVVAYVAFFGLFALFFLAVLFDAPTGGAFPASLLVGGGLFAIAMLVMAVVILVSLVLPVALYLDADAIETVADDWDPDPVLYAGVAALGLFTQGIPVQPAVAAYYLYRRHEHLGTP